MACRQTFPSRVDQCWGRAASLAPRLRLLTEYLQRGVYVATDTIGAADDDDSWSSLSLGRGMREFPKRERPMVISVELKGDQ